MNPNLNQDSVGKLLSVLYQGLVMTQGISTVYFREKWETELKMEISKDDWYNVCKV